MKKHIAILAMILLVTASLFATGEAEEMQPGEKVTIVTNIRDTHPPAAGMGTLTDNMWTQWINENAPVNVEFMAIHPRDTVERFNILFASGDVPDLIAHPWQNVMNPWADQGLLLPLDDLIDDTVHIRRMFEENPQYLPRARAGDGSIYFLGNSEETGPNWTLFYRKDWLENLGLEVPETLDEFIDVATAFTFDDPDGNGQDDTYGYGLAFVSGWFVDAWHGVTGNDFYIEGDSLVHDFTRRYEATKVKKQMFDAGIVSPDWLADTSGSSARTDFLTGRQGIFGLGHGNVLGNDIQATFFENNPDGVMGVLPTPITQFGRYSGAVQMPVQTRYAINVDTEYPEETMAYADFIASPEAIKMLQYGVEGRHYFFNDRGGAVGVTEAEDPVAFQEKRILGNFFTWFLPSAYGVERSFWDPELTLNRDDPYAVNRYNLVQEAKALYIRPESPFNQQIANGPAFPTELQLVQTALEPIGDMWDRAVVSGDSYTPEDALAEAQALWDSAGGPQLEAFMDQWFKQSRDTLLLTSEWY